MQTSGSPQMKIYLAQIEEVHPGVNSEVQLFCGIFFEEVQPGVISEVQLFFENEVKNTRCLTFTPKKTLEGDAPILLS